MNSQNFPENSVERNHYNLRSRKVAICSPRTIKEHRLSRKRRYDDKNNLMYLPNEDPDSGFTDDIKSPPILKHKRVNTFSNWRKALNWIEKQRDIGLYIECCNLSCKKFRYCEKYHDPIDVPELWFCHDLGGGVTCETPEEHIPHSVENDMIENTYTAGSLVWARWPGFPWWPGMVCDSPETMSYYLLEASNNEKPVRYHVIYFSNIGKIERSWLKERCIKPFAKTPRNKLNKRMIYRNRDFTEEVDGAYEIATAILKNDLSISERLRGYSFLSSFGGYSPSSVASLKSFRSVGTITPYKDNDSYSSKISQDYIPGTPKKTPKFQRYLKKIQRKKLFKQSK